MAMYDLDGKLEPGTHSDVSTTHSVIIFLDNLYHRHHQMMVPVRGVSLVPLQPGKLPIPVDVTSDVTPG